jgi:hypothetical protein
VEVDRSLNLCDEARILSAAVHSITTNTSVVNAEEAGDDVIFMWLHPNASGPSDVVVDN